jgi:hypothetical protein
MPNLKAIFGHPRYRFETSLFYECGQTPEGHHRSHEKCPGYLRDMFDFALIKLCECPEHQDVQELLGWVRAGDKAGDS